MKNLIRLLFVPFVLLIGPALTATPIVSVNAIPAKKPVPPVFYQMFDNEGTDFQSLVPERGPVGSVQWATWQTVNPARGQYNWNAMDARLKAVEGMTITLTTGEVVPHPVVLQVFPYISSAYGWSYEFYDCTPQWIYKEMGDRPSVGGRLVGHKLTGCGYTAVMPAYDSWLWRSALLDFISAFGAKYDGNPQVAGIVIASGIDGETNPIKNYHCQWESIIDTQAPGVKYRFGQVWRDMLTEYNKAFPTTQVWIDNVSGGSGTRKASSAAAAALGIGLQNSAMTVDIDSHTGYGGWTGQWDPAKQYSQTLSMNYETRMGYGSAETQYWTLLAGLHYHPSVLTVHPDYLTVLDSELLGWANDHIGATVEDATSVWTVLRDYEYPKVVWGSNSLEGASGKMGDWSFWLERLDVPGAKAERTFDVPDHPLYSRQARKTDQDSGNPLMVFAVDPGFIRPCYNIRVIFADVGTDTLSLRWNANEAIYYKKGTNKWIEWDVLLVDYGQNGQNERIVLDCNGDGDEVVHMVEVEQCSVGPTITNTPTVTNTPTHTPSPSKTATPTITRTTTPTKTPTMTKTMVKTATPTETLIPVYADLSAICDQCILAFDGERWRVSLQSIDNAAIIVKTGDKLWACRPGACDWGEIMMYIPNISKGDGK